MSLSKRVVLTVLCLVAVALPAAAPAAPTRYDGTVTLQPVGDEPTASGSAKVSCGWVYGHYGWGGYGYGWHLEGTVSVSCKGLTPSKEYAVLPGVFPPPSGIANQKGVLTITRALWDADALPTQVTVWRSAPNGALVLSGSIVWK
jgi:hypothetical protein